MRLAKGPRPTSIRIFIGVFFSAALLRFFDTLFCPQYVATIARQLFDFTPTADQVFVFASVWLSIAFIPMAMIWFFALPFARNFVTAMIGLQLATIIGGLIWLPDMISTSRIHIFIVPMLILAARALFWPTAQDWFKNSGYEPERFFQ